jgi:tripartite-type tricarboxylate transporter receptor subunit TctC
MTERRNILRGAAAWAAACALPQAQAQSNDLVKIVCGFPAGGTADATARRVAEGIAGSPYTSQPAIVENRVGAGGRLACETVKSAPPDGRTLLLTPLGSLSLYPHVFRDLRYDPVRDFAPVSTATLMTQGLAVGPMVPASVKTLRDFIDWVRANPDKAAYGSPGAGTAPHFLMALLALRSGVPMSHVPYRGSVPGVTDLAGGQIAAMCTPTGDFLAFHRAGKLRLLATSGTSRSSFAPEVPTFAEGGFPELVSEDWFGFLAPAGTPRAMIASANAAIRAALTKPSFVTGMTTLGLGVGGSTPEAMLQSIQQDHARWAPLVRQIGFKADS